ncbi:MAG: hypothetical protein M1825_005028 [Sarcosagium campestre]|nr:MAG: hypothetical protein M1825_005028 [Sarcosagium campestre]
MSDPKRVDSPVSPIKPTSGSGAESPTTARELDFDDDPHDPAISGADPSTNPQSQAAASRLPVPGSGEDVAPPKPPRPLSPLQQAESTLREAFPAIDAAVIKAVLTASGGKVEPAFNALLGMSDPDAHNEAPPPPPKQQRQQSPLAPVGSTSTPRNQLEADELYARQLAEHYSGPTQRGSSRTGTRQSRSRERETGLKPNELYDKEHSFIDDDLPVIKENLRKSFFETQNKVNKWVTDFKKKLDGEEDDEDRDGASSSQRYSDGRPQQNYAGRRSSEIGRRSSERERERYDADPRVLGDDFAGLELRDDEAPRRPPRPQANPNLFGSTPTTPPSGGRRVSFQEGPPEEIKSQSPRPINRQPSPAGGKSSKWQPMAAVDPTPVADNDPFSLGDSDDEREAKSKDVRSEDTERLKRAAAEAMSEDIGGQADKKTLEPHAQSGTKDKEAEDKLAGSS